MNQFSFALFKTVFWSMKQYMHAGRTIRDKVRKLPEGIVKKTYRYWQDGQEAQECNIYALSEEQPEKNPVLIDIHGGCWLYGDKDVYDHFSYNMVQKGFDVSSLTYRTIDQVHLRQQVQDVFNYLNFLEARQHEMGIDLSKAALTGDSAGAQLSLLCLSINQSEKLRKIFDVQQFHIDFKAVVLTHPVCFIDEAGRLPNWDLISRKISIPGLQTYLYGKNFHDQEDHGYSVNPYAYIKKSMKFPRILLVSSEGDKMFKGQTKMLMKALDQKNIKYDLYFDPDPYAVHVFNVVNPYLAKSEKCNSYITRFIMESMTEDQQQEA
ncbi:MAG: alpha/beta hydrolase [Erysipelotrichaceae bacterium]|nr:alpha/beta hydrolase [Erysipelotrichaceae bacterium]